MNRYTAYLLSFVISILSIAGYAEDIKIIDMYIENHLFYPSYIELPADTKIKLIITNKDQTPEEFESHELNREKIILGGKTAILFIGPVLQV